LIAAGLDAVCHLKKEQKSEAQAEQQNLVASMIKDRLWLQGTDTRQLEAHVKQCIIFLGR